MRDSFPCTNRSLAGFGNDAEALFDTMNASPLCVGPPTGIGALLRCGRAKIDNNRSI